MVYLPENYNDSVSSFATIAFSFGADAFIIRNLESSH
jgi:hypothetical protein